MAQVNSGISSWNLSVYISCYNNPSISINSKALTKLFYSVFFAHYSYIYASLFIILMNRIKEVLEQKGIKQVWLADQLGKSYNIVNGYVQNRSQPSIEVLYKIAGYLAVDPRDLLVAPTKSSNP